MTYFVDRDLGPRVGEALRSVKVDTVLHRERFGPATPDDIWIPAVAADGLVILTRDRHIRSRRAERDVFVDAGAKCIVVTTRVSTPLDDLRALLIAWPRIEDHVANTPGPFMFGLARDGRLTQYIPTSGSFGPEARKQAMAAKRDARRKILAQPPSGA